MKVKKIFITSIIINILSIGVIYNFIKKDYINNEKIIVKALTEKEYETNITSLNTSHEEYANYIKESKTKIAIALTNEGVTTSNEETLETMATNIGKVLQERTSDATATADNITEGKTAWVNGKLIRGTGLDNKNHYENGMENSNIKKVVVGFTSSGTGAGSADIKNYTTRYAELTAENFALNLKGVSGISSPYSSYCGSSASASTTFTYNSSTGIISFSGTRAANIGDTMGIATIEICMFIPQSWLDI